MHIAYNLQVKHNVTWWMYWPQKTWYLNIICSHWSYLTQSGQKQSPHNQALNKMKHDNVSTLKVTVWCWVKVCERDLIVSGSGLETLFVCSFWNVWMCFCCERFLYLFGWCVTVLQLDGCRGGKQSVKQTEVGVGLERKTDI